MNYRAPGRLARSAMLSIDFKYNSSLVLDVLELTL